MIDLRSDTVTRPTAEMRRAMADAEVGDDVYGEDPTVIALQERAAELFGREAALFCPSGVMCNQLWLRVLARPGTEVVVEADSHVVNYEGGAGALLAGVQFRTVGTVRGQMSADDVAANIRADHFPLTPTSLVWLEQTHNRRGGTYYSLPDLTAIAGVCRAAGVALYVDGARIFNAAVASGTEPAAYAGQVDGLMFCLSKALGAPVGSVMVGNGDAIADAREWRRRYGGAMRQAGVIAAAGLVALDRVDRLAQDHANAQVLAEAAAEVHPDGVDLDAVQTNIVYVEDIDAGALASALLDAGVLAGAMDARTLRMVTHPDVTADDCATAADALRQALKQVPGMTASADRLPPGQYEARGWPALHFGEIPTVDLAAWRFRIHGAVATERTFTLDEFKALPNDRLTADFHCVTKFSVFDNEWEGVRVSQVLATADPKPGATHVMVEAVDGYTANLPLEVIDDDDTLFAWGRNGAEITPEHGWPLRLIVPKRYAWKSVKWVSGMELMAGDRRGFWEERGYHNEADPWREERYSYQETA